MVTANALSFIREEKPDFAFVYLGLTDSAGHQYGWMGEEYLQACRQSLDEIQMLTESFMDEYTIIITADHGGHDRTHGSLEKKICLSPLSASVRISAPVPVSNRPESVILHPQ